MTLDEQIKRAEEALKDEIWESFRYGDGTGMYVKPNHMSKRSFKEISKPDGSKVYVNCKTGKEVMEAEIV